MGYNHKLCEDEDDAARMSETILRALGFTNVQRGLSIMDVNDKLDSTTLLNIARNAERIARWARAEAKNK